MPVDQRSFLGMGLIVAILPVLFFFERVLVVWKSIVIGALNTDPV